MKCIKKNHNCQCVRYGIVCDPKAMFSGYQDEPKLTLRNMRFAAFDSGQIFEFRIKKAESA